MVSAMINAVAAMTGGMIWPPLEAQASTAPAKAGGKPTFFIRGMVKVPVVTTLPAALPLTVPMMAEETSKFEKNVLLERLAEAKIAAAPVMTVADVANDPHFRDERSMYTEVTHPQLGPVRITNQAVKMSETNPYVRGCAPLLGEHNDEVYQSLGFTPEEISAWREKGVI